MTNFFSTVWSNMLAKTVQFCRLLSAVTFFGTSSMLTSRGRLDTIALSLTKGTSTPPLRSSSVWRKWAEQKVKYLSSNSPTTSWNLSKNRTCVEFLFNYTSLYQPFSFSVYTFMSTILYFWQSSSVISKESSSKPVH